MHGQAMQQQKLLERRQAVLAVEKCICNKTEPRKIICQRIGKSCRAINTTSSALALTSPFNAMLHTVRDAYNCRRLLRQRRPDNRKPRAASKKLALPRDTYKTSEPRLVLASPEVPHPQQYQNGSRARHEQALASAMVVPLLSSRRAKYCQK